MATTSIMLLCRTDIHGQPWPDHAVLPICLKPGRTGCRGSRDGRPAPVQRFALNPPRINNCRWGINSAVAAALSLVLMVVCVIVMGVGDVFTRRRERRAVSAGH
jgi:hypothetical protein